MIDWIFKNLGVVIFLVIVISQMVRGVMRARQATAERETAPVDYDEQRRLREGQEKIRRQIAARRGGQAPATPLAPPPPVSEAQPPPLVRPETTQLPELFGGPLGRMLEELQKRAQPQPEAAPPPLVSARVSNAELERQEELAAQLKALEEARADAKRRAAHVVEGKRVTAESEPALRSAARGQLLADLSDPKSLRRAFVLREVLGAPVALR